MEVQETKQICTFYFEYLETTQAKHFHSPENMETCTNQGM